MSKTNLQFENAAQQFLNKNPELVAKYYSPSLLKTLVDAMQSSLPTVTTAKITFDRLVADGSLQRTDGKSEEDDLRANVDRAQANLENSCLMLLPAKSTIRIPRFTIREGRAHGCSEAI